MAIFPASQVSASFPLTLALLREDNPHHFWGACRSILRVIRATTYRFSSANRPKSKRIPSAPQICFQLCNFGAVRNRFCGLYELGAGMACFLFFTACLV